MSLFAHLPSGLLFGLVAGISPGPLFALVITETLRHGRRQGIIVATVPLITDAPIVAIALIVLSRIAQYDTVLGILSVIGALYIAFLAYENISTRSGEIQVGESIPHSFRKGILTNFLSPHPYLFWATIGTPLVVQAARIHPSAAVLFILGFYMGLIGSKITVAIIVEKSRRFISGKIYVYVLRLLGVALAVFSVLFIREGLMLFGIGGE